MTYAFVRLGSIHLGLHRSRSGRFRRRFLLGLTVSGLSTCLALATLEGILRLGGDRARFFASTANAMPRCRAMSEAGIFEELEDEVRRYALRPGAACEIDGMLFRVSSHRTRGPDFPAEKPPGEKRLLALGDSYCFGLWCDEDETVVERIARLATERESEIGSGITWRAINAGVPGYHTGQEYLALLQEGLKLDPDLVLLYFDTNDIEADGYFYDADLGVLRRDDVSLPTGLRRALWHSHLYGWLARLAHRTDRDTGGDRLQRAYACPRNRQACADALRAITECCRQNALPLFVLHQPQLTWQGGLRASDWAMLPAVEWVEALRTELAVPGVNLLSLLRGWSDNVDHGRGHYDFLLGPCFSDTRVQTVVDWARRRALQLGGDWDTLDYDGRLALMRTCPLEIPRDIDFHLTGEGYAHIARVAHAALRAQGLLP